MEIKRDLYLNKPIIRKQNGFIKVIKKQYTEEELKEIQKQNDDTMVINTLLM